jgi:type II secretory pathway component PulF
MPIFQYKAFSAGGAVTSGVIDADTTRDARQRLRRENLLVSEIHETRGGRRVQRTRARSAASSTASAGTAPPRPGRACGTWRS